MSQELPVGSFEWKDDIEHFDVMNVPGNSNKGYILEVDFDMFYVTIRYSPFILGIHLFLQYMII